MKTIYTKRTVSVNGHDLTPVLSLAGAAMQLSMPQPTDLDKLDDFARTTEHYLDAASFFSKRDFKVAPPGSLAALRILVSSVILVCRVG